MNQESENPSPPAASDRFSPHDFADELSALEAAGHRHFLEGGQAVNIWASVYLKSSPKLEDLRPFTSKDCDL